MSAWKGTFATIATTGALAALVHTTALAVYHIPSESMVPTLEVGDRLAVTKFSYGWSRYSIPFGQALPDSIGGRLLAATPARGDVAVFAHPKSKRTMIKRVIGLPGDRVALKGGRLYLNGALVERRLSGAYRIREHEGDIVTVRRFIELLPGTSGYTIAVTPARPHGRDLAEVLVPAGHLFMLGDNRDNSSDSRYDDMGLVPIENLIGRAETILFSLKSCAAEPGLVCAARRYLTQIH